MFFITAAQNDIGGTNEGPVTEESEGHESATYLIFIVLLIVSMLAIKLVHKIQLKYNVLPESAIILILGLFVGLLDHLLGGNMKKQMQFNRSMFEYFILPPIIFESGFALESACSRTSAPYSSTPYSAPSSPPSASAPPSSSSAATPPSPSWTPTTPSNPSYSAPSSPPSIPSLPSPYSPRCSVSTAPPALRRHSSITSSSARASSTTPSPSSSTPYSSST
eukprot:gb/GECH01010524.1/.p1 GENE.gb/GECH01010524.1/~~gb/GECH01010524.1/.p1  ORF type:complete len:221 (+),score=31.72 gb/GECH01010524.1/:1-663(+)